MNFTKIKLPVYQILCRQKIEINYMKSIQNMKYCTIHVHTHFKMCSLLQNIRDNMTSLTVDWCLV